MKEHSTYSKLVLLALLVFACSLGYGQASVLSIKIAPVDSIMVNGVYTPFEDLRQVLVKHISDPIHSENSPEVDFEGIGRRKSTNLITSYTVHLSTSFDLYMEVQEEIAAAYTEVRNQRALEAFGVSYESMLEDKESFERQIQIIQELVPKRVTEADLLKE